MSTEEIRVELGELMHQNITDSLPVDPTKREIGAQVDTTIDVLLAAGYRKPQQVTTIEELDALEVGTVVRGKWLAEKWAEDGDEVWYVAGKAMFWTNEDLTLRGGLPATVLHVGGAE